MSRRPWMYLAVIAVAVFWGLPEIVLWGLCAVMAVDLIRKWFAPARERLRECERAALADTLIEDAAGQQWRRSPSGRITAICQHPGAVEVRRVPVTAVGVTDEIVAWWCDACKTQLPADWVPGERLRVPDHPPADYDG